AIASACQLGASISSHSSSTGTPCSSTKTLTRMAPARSRASSQRQIRTEADIGQDSDSQGYAADRTRGRTISLRWHTMGGPAVLTLQKQGVTIADGGVTTRSGLQAKPAAHVQNL